MYANETFLMLNNSLIMAAPLEKSCTLLMQLKVFTLASEKSQKGVFSNENAQTVDKVHFMDDVYSLFFIIDL